MRFLLTIQYLGTRYAGWQSQTNAVAIQDVVETVLGRMFNAPLRIEGAGRTDAGVHARGQRAHVDIPRRMDGRGVMQGMNNLLPHDIRVTAAEHIDDTFHCRFAAKQKTYVYRMWNGEVADVFTAATHAHVPRPLDEEAMRRAAGSLIGRHDFAPFTVASPEVSSTERTISALSLRRDGSAITISITADGFLRYMVRRIAGSLIEVGHGKLDELWHEARWTAPPKGLTLWDVAY